MRRIVVAALSLTAGASFAETPYDGLFRPDASWATNWDCKTIGSDGGALAIMDDTFYGVESACKLTNPVNVRDMAATLYDAQCQGEGETYGYRVLFMTAGSDVVMVRDGGQTYRLVRCE